jgi:hypothetical protein
MMMGSWLCKVSSEIHINGWCVSELVRKDKDKRTATEPGDEKDPKRTHVVLSKGHEVVGPGYSSLTGAAAKVTDMGENLANSKRVNRVRKMEQHYPSQGNLVNQISSADQRAGWVSRFN